MRTASNSPLTQKYGDKTTHVSITVLFVLKLTWVAWCLNTLHRNTDQTNPFKTFSRHFELSAKCATDVFVYFPVDLVMNW